MNTDEPDSYHTHVATNNVTNGNSAPTVPYEEPAGGGGHTVIRQLNDTGTPNPDGGRRVVGLLVSYSSNPAGEVFKVYEGKNIIGRGAECDISFPNDSNMSREHMLIQYIEAKGAFRATDRGSSNGTYINGEISVLGDIIELKTNDVIVLGGTKLVFLAVPEF